MSMKIKILNILYKTLIIAGLLIGVSILNTCTYPEQKSEAKKTEISFSKDKFYFNKYVKYVMTGRERSMHSIYHDGGSIEIYGDVVRIKSAKIDLNYIINKRVYNEEDEVYEFYADEVVLEFDVNKKTLTIYNNDGSGYVFRINSTIKSNW